MVKRYHEFVIRRRSARGPCGRCWITRASHGPRWEAMVRISGKIGGTAETPRGRHG